MPLGPAPSPKMIRNADKQTSGHVGMRKYSLSAKIT